MKKYSLPKKERISLKKDFDYLFSKGKTLTIFPFKIFYAFLNNTPNVKISISIPTKIFKKSVKRNYLKRIIKESYRKNKHILFNCDLKHTVFIHFNYVHNSIISYNEMEAYIKNILLEIKKIYNTFEEKQNEVC